MQGTPNLKERPIMATYNQQQAEQKRDEILKGGRDRYDHVKIEPVDSTKLDSPKKVLARRHDDHTKWEEQ